MSYRFNPFISFYYSLERKKLILFEPLKKKTFEIKNNLFFDLLKYCKKAKEKENIVKKLKKILSVNSKDAEEITKNLVKLNILLKQNKSLENLIKKRDEWFSYGWGSSFYYHLASKDFEFLDYSKDSEVLKDQQLMERYVKENEQPSIYKEYKTKNFYKLTNPKNFKLIKFPPSGKILGELNKEKLSYMLYLTFGEIFSVDFPIIGKVLVKTSPSGGARHPSEAYVIVLKDIGIPKGVYHYSVKRNGLEHINDIANKNKIIKHFYKANHIKEFKPKVIIIISSMFERNMWRYRELRTFRVIFLDIGHLLSTLRMVINSLGLDVLINHSFDDSFVQQLLKLNEGGERPLYCAIVGNYEKRNWQFNL